MTGTYEVNQRCGVDAVRRFSRFFSRRLNRSSHDDVGAMLETLSIDDRQNLINAMSTIERLLDGETDHPEIKLRPHEAGDMGWVIQQHGLLYAQEYGWDISFEAVVADIAARFLKNFDPSYERSWIAEIDGYRVGSVFLLKESAEVAKLRLLLVDPLGRGRGLGRRLVEECMAFARSCGYCKITLRTENIQLVARGIYESSGFVRVASKPHHSFGQDLVAETWEFAL